ncbi:hypothetical protein NE237_001129 [Protea cynaroides]|uniref:RNase H type-1 domain-containing protein n=1 Tax=Protea cynaroides TaxID=273540 RepID=A0A9Q0KSF7_9MAGN|nr:hypothetical protein NE237_001129 [Protea cynaroides]
MTFSTGIFLGWLYLLDWKAHNEPYFEQKDSSPIDVILRAEKAFMEYPSITFPSQASSSSESRGTTSLSPWIPPPNGVLKLNTDAAFKDSSSASGIGYVVRKSMCNPLLSVSHFVPFQSVIIGEAIAVRSNLLEAFKAGYSSLLVELDCLDLIKLLNGDIHQGDVYLRAMLMTFRQLLKKGLFHLVMFLGRPIEWPML